MAKISLARLDVGALLKLRDDIGAILSRRADELKIQIARLGGDAVSRGRKVPPKYRDPATGETWAGRGARPRWLVARLKAGKKLQNFLIDKSAKKGRKEKVRRKK
jgi:DNA-binding protein H-NS